MRGSVFENELSPIQIRCVNAGALDGLDEGQRSSLSASFLMVIASLRRGPQRRVSSFGPETDLFVIGWVQAVRPNVYGFCSGSRSQSAIKRARPF